MKMKAKTENERVHYLSEAILNQKSPFWLRKVFSLFWLRKIFSLFWLRKVLSLF